MDSKNYFNDKGTAEKWKNISNSRIRKCLKQTRMLSYLNWRKKVCYFQWSETHKMQERDKKGGEANASPSWEWLMFWRGTGSLTFRVCRNTTLQPYEIISLRPRETGGEGGMYPLLITTYCRLRPTNQKRYYSHGKKIREISKEKSGTVTMSIFYWINFPLQIVLWIRRPFAG